MSLPAAGALRRQQALVLVKADRPGRDIEFACQVADAVGGFAAGIGGAHIAQQHNWRESQIFAKITFFGIVYLSPDHILAQALQPVTRAMLLRAAGPPNHEPTANPAVSAR